MCADLEDGWIFIYYQDLTFSALTVNMSKYILEKIVIEEMWDLQEKIWKRKKKIVSYLGKF